MRFAFLFLLLMGSSCYGQVTSFYQAQFNGGVTGCGYGPDYSGSGTGTFTLSIAPGSTVYKAWLFAGRQGVASALTVNFSGTSFTFDNSNQVSNTFNSPNYGNASAVHAIDVSSVINPAQNTYTLSLPFQSGPQDRFQDFYLYVAYANNSMSLVTTCIFLNAADMQPNVNDVLNVNYAFDNTQNIGMAMYLGYACSTGDGEALVVNGTNLGTMGGSNTNSGSCAGPYGDFVYQNGGLTGLLDCNANQATNGTDALSNIQGLVTNCSNSLTANFSHSSSDNAIWGIFLTYSSGAKPMNMDTAICAGTPVQLNVGSGSVTWSPSTNLSCSNCGNPVATPTTSTTYIATITGSACGSTVMDTDIITVFSGGTITAQASPAIICAGDTVHLSIAGDSVVTWAPSAGLSCTVCSNPVATPSSSLKYYATAGGSGCLATDSVAVTVNPLPVAQISSSTDKICPNDSVQICALPGYTYYLWNNNPTGLCTEATGAGTYYVTVTDNNNCTAESNHITITQLPAPVVTITASPVTICPNDSAQICAPPGFMFYQWNSNNNFDNCMETKNAGNYYVAVLDTNGCSALSNTVNISVIQPAPVNISANPATVCLGDSAQICAPPGYVSYTWNTAGNTNCMETDTDGDYYVTVKDNNGCMVESNHVGIVVLQPPAATITALRDTICPNDSVQICASFGFVSYTWNNNMDSGTCIEAKNQRDYYVTVTDNNGCTAESNHISINLLQAPPVALSENGDTLSVYLAVGVQWYFNGNAIPGANSNIYIAHTSGNYQVEVTDTNGCSSISTPVIYTGIENINGIGIFSIYPNPSSAGSWQLTVGSALIGAQAEILDDNGRIVYKTEIENHHTEIPSPSAAGVYLLRITNGNANIVRKIVKL